MKALGNFGDVLSRLKPGASVVLHSMCAEPLFLSRELAKHAASSHGLTVYTLMPMGDAPYARAEADGSLSVTTFFPGKGLREAVNAGRANIWRCSLSQIPGLFRSGRIRADLLLLQLSPPDTQGRMSLGVSVDYMRAVLDQDPIVIAEINPRMPVTCGNTTVTVDQVDYMVEATTPPCPLPPAEPDEVDRRIAENIAGLVQSGDVIQAGIGSLPDLVLGQLGHLSNLGIHSGVITDAAMRLIQKGVITNDTKKVFKGKSVATMAGGTQAFYDFLHRNPDVELHPSSLTHDQNILAAIDGLCAINSILQIDLAGRANAEQVGRRTISTPGGLPDFTRGACRAKGGKSIVALRAASKDGKHSNILPRLAEETPVAITADVIDFVVTEYGVARLRDQSPERRVRELATVAHPDFRSSLSGW